MTEPDPVQLTRLEVFWLLRRLRRDRDAIAEDLLLLEERVRAGVNGHLKGAYIALDADRAIAEGVIAKLWRIVAHFGGDPTSGRMPTAHKKK